MESKTLGVYVCDVLRAFMLNATSVSKLLGYVTLAALLKGV